MIKQDPNLLQVIRSFIKLPGFFTLYLNRFKGGKSQIVQT